MVQDNLSMPNVNEVPCTCVLALHEAQGGCVGGCGCGWGVWGEWVGGDVWVRITT